MSKKDAIVSALIMQERISPLRRPKKKETPVIPPTRVDSPSRALRQYMKRFYNWSLKLNDEDLRAVVGFCQTVQSAWVQGGGPKRNAKPAEPDANCISTADGGCIGGTQAGKEPCMHDESVHQGEPKAAACRHLAIEQIKDLGRDKIVVRCTTCKAKLKEIDCDPAN